MDVPRVIAVSNRKGGTGKSTTVVNLAAAWAQQGLRVLVVDLDTQGHAGLGLGVPPQRRRPGVHGLLASGETSPAAALLDTCCDRVALLPADTAARREPEAPAERLAALLSRAGGPWDRVLLDTPPSAGVLLDNALAAAHGGLVPLQPHGLAAEGVRQLAQLFFRTASSVNPALQHLAILPVMRDPRLRLHRRVIEDLGRQFGDFRLLRGIRTDIRLAEAFSAGQPVLQYAPRGRGAMDYQLLADELTALWKLPPSA